MCNRKEQYQIREAKASDTEALQSIYEDARAFMRNHGNPHQWGENYPSKEQIEQDIADEESYVLVRNGRICGVFVFSIRRESSYDRIWDGAWKNEKSYGVIHRIASKKGEHGILESCLSFCVEKCETIRIDTHEDNQVMQQALKKYGFVYCGKICLEDGTIRLAFQKI